MHSQIVLIANAVRDDITGARRERLHDFHQHSTQVRRQRRKEFRRHWNFKLNDARAACRLHRAHRDQQEILSLLDQSGELALPRFDQPAESFGSSAKSIANPGKRASYTSCSCAATIRSATSGETPPTRLLSADAICSVPSASISIRRCQSW